MKRSQAFTIVEVLIAGSLLVMVLAAAVALARVALQSSQINAERMQATNLAQEGIELVRGLRDKIYIDGKLNNGQFSWKEYLVVNDQFQQPVGVKFIVVSGEGSWGLQPKSPPSTYYETIDICADGNVRDDTEPGTCSNGPNHTYRRYINITNPIVGPDDFKIAPVYGANDGDPPPTTNVTEHYAMATVIVEWEDFGTTWRVEERGILTDWKPQG